MKIHYFDQKQSKDVQFDSPKHSYFSMVVYLSHKPWDLTLLLVQLISVQVGFCLKKMADNRCGIKEVMGKNIVC